MNENAVKLKSYLDTELGQDIQTIISYTIRKTPTKVDDKILDNVDDINDLLSETIDNIADIEPTDKDAKAAIVRVLELIAQQTKTPWDDRMIAIAKPFIK